MGVYLVGADASAAAEKSYVGSDARKYGARSALPGILDIDTPLLLAWSEVDPPRLVAQGEKLKEMLCHSPTHCPHTTILSARDSLASVFSPEAASASLAEPTLELVREIGARGLRKTRATSSFETRARAHPRDEVLDPHGQLTPWRPALGGLPFSDFFFGGLGFRLFRFLSAPLGFRLLRFFRRLGATVLRGKSNGGQILARIIFRNRCHRCDQIRRRHPAGVDGLQDQHEHIFRPLPYWNGGNRQTDIRTLDRHETDRDTIIRVGESGIDSKTQLSWSRCFPLPRSVADGARPGTRTTSGHPNCSALAPGPGRCASAARSSAGFDCRPGNLSSRTGLFLILPICASLNFQSSLAMRRCIFGVLTQNPVPIPLLLARTC